jgi:hypothetical protein
VDSELVALASAGACRHVDLMTTDAWKQVKGRVAALFGRGKADRSELVASDLDASRTVVVDAGERGDDVAIAEVEADWKSRLQRLLAAEPGVVGELRRILEQLHSPLRPAPEPIAMTARAAGHGRVYQAGRNQHIGEK